MEMHQVRYFIAAARTLSFTRAASVDESIAMADYRLCVRCSVV